MAFLARLEGSDTLIVIKGHVWLSANRQAMTDEKPHPTRTDLARQAAAGYASDQREIINKLRKKLAVILHRMWIDGTEFNWSKKEIVA